MTKQDGFSYTVLPFISAKERFRTACRQVFFIWWSLFASIMFFLAIISEDFHVLTNENFAPVSIIVLIGTFFIALFARIIIGFARFIGPESWRN